MLVLVTGAAGFIGYHAAARLLDTGCAVIGIDNLNPYYDVGLKRARLGELDRRGGAFTFHQIDITDMAAMTALAERYADIAAIIHLAAQAGVRYSLEHPLAYVEANVAGQVAVLEAARRLRGISLWWPADRGELQVNLCARFAETQGAAAGDSRNLELVPQRRAHWVGRVRGQV
jgi:nucleoside-diphosphate-sugar epimerase